MNVLRSYMQSMAQFMLSQADEDSRSPETGLCFISDKNFVLLGALFAYFIPSSVAVVFAVLCRAEVRQLEAHLYSGARAANWSGRTSIGQSVTSDNVTTACMEVFAICSALLDTTTTTTTAPN